MGEGASGVDRRIGDIWGRARVGYSFGRILEVKYTERDSFRHSMVCFRLSKP